MAKKRDNRTIFQLAWAALTNGYALGYVEGRIFSGWSKSICLPGLNCYSCPGALGACPIGALQAVLGGRGAWFSFYVVGFLLCVGSLFGRFICGWACPFGMLQDLIYKIPLPKGWKRKSLPGHRRLIWVKYGVLLLFVILGPLLLVDAYGLGSPQFCKWICPSGTMAGGLLLSVSAPLRSLIGNLFMWKIALALLILIGAAVYYRPFCKYLCPLGAVYAPMNRVALSAPPGGRTRLHPLRRVREGLRNGRRPPKGTQQPGMHPLRRLREDLPDARHRPRGHPQDDWRKRAC